MKVLEVEQLSKKYRIYHGEQQDDFWALRDINFSIEAGERIGIIGKNGSGKSTLLKILSKITHPTAGKATMRGRVASLLEVGTGFHPDLTGRENIFLNGAILGMKKKDIAKEFDGIVDFSEVENFIDTPIKYYSSGMYVRLAFSVAAHLSPDILIADEVLSVGDISFQKKSIDKMTEIASKGATILYVSHSMSSLKEFCESAIILEKGRLLSFSPIENAINAYLEKDDGLETIPLNQRKDRTGNQLIKFTMVDFFGNESSSKTVCSDPLTILVGFYSTENIRSCDALFSISIINQMGEKVCSFFEIFTKKDFNKNDDYIIKIFIPCLNLNPGKYSINIFSRINGEIADWIKHTKTFEITPDKNNFKATLIPYSSQGICHIAHDLKIDKALKY